MIKKPIYILLTGAALVFGCQHEPGHVPAAPEIDISSPTSDVVFNNGDTIFMDAMLSDEDVLHEATIMINQDTTDTFFLYQPYVHDLDSFHVDTFWVVTGISGPTPSYVTFQAFNHHDKVTTINLSILLQL